MGSALLYLRPREEGTRNFQESEMFEHTILLAIGAGISIAAVLWALRPIPQTAMEVAVDLEG